MDNLAIEMINITKTFPGIIANDRVNLRVKKGEVHALLGENGAGKSTLMSILFGAYNPDSGIIKINGKQVTIKDPNVATSLKIGMVHQHFKLVHNFTVAENITLGIEKTKKFKIIDKISAEKKVEELSTYYGLNVNPKELIENITVGQQQRVEILKTLYRDADIIILDEPTAVLTPQEIDELIMIIKRLKDEGKTIVIITHKLKEIKAVADRCTILRRGKYIDTVDVDKVSEKDLASLMVGRVVKFEIEKEKPNLKDVFLKVDNITVKDKVGNIRVQDLSLELRGGEILGIAGVDGNGQSQLISALTGLLPIIKGDIYLKGRNITKFSVKDRIKEGLGCIYEDRKKHGFVSEFSIAENSVIKNFYNAPYTNKMGVLNYNEMRKVSDKLIEDFDIRCAMKSDTLSGSLSGGNQQKSIIAREIFLQSEVLIVAQPTRGLDVGAIEYIRKRILRERDNGKAILLISFELDEIISLCDRIATISKGKIVGTFDSDKVSEREIGLMMAGIKEKNSEKE